MRQILLIICEVLFVLCCYSFLDSVLMYKFGCRTPILRIVWGLVRLDVLSDDTSWVENIINRYLHGVTSRLNLERDKTCFDACCIFRKFYNTRKTVDVEALRMIEPPTTEVLANYYSFKDFNYPVDEKHLYLYNIFANSLYDTYYRYMITKIYSYGLMHSMKLKKIAKSLIDYNQLNTILYYHLPGIIMRMEEELKTSDDPIKTLSDYFDIPSSQFIAYVAFTNPDYLSRTFDQIYKDDERIDNYFIVKIGEDEATNRNVYTTLSSAIAVWSQTWINLFKDDVEFRELMIKAKVKLDDLLKPIDIYV